MPGKIINTFDQLLAAREVGLPDVAIVPRRLNGGRDSWRDGWKIYRPKFNLGSEKNQFDWDYGYKVFSEMYHTPECRKEAFNAAKQWVKERYKIESFIRNTMFDYVDRRVNERFPLPKKPRKIKK